MIPWRCGNRKGYGDWQKKPKFFWGAVAVVMAYIDKLLQFTTLVAGFF